MIIPYEDKKIEIFPDRIVLSKKPVRHIIDGTECDIWLNKGCAVTYVGIEQVCEDGRTIYGNFGCIDSACYYIEAEDAKEQFTPQLDNVDHPSHYQTDKGIEVIDVIEAFTEQLTGVVAFDIGCAIKYMCRWKKKNGKEDLRKAIWYLEHAIKKTEEEDNGSVHSG